MNIVIHSSCSNKHIANIRPMAQAEFNHQACKSVRNMFINRNPGKFFKMFFNTRHFIFIQSSKINFSNRYFANIQVLFTNAFALLTNIFIPFIQFYDNVSIKDYRLFFCHAFSFIYFISILVFSPVPNVSQKSSLLLNLVGGSFFVITLFFILLIDLTKLSSFSRFKSNSAYEGLSTCTISCSMILKIYKQFQCKNT